MTQLGEAVTIAILTDAVAECPFQTPSPPSVSVEGENPAKDDVNRVQDNDGGVLGRNVAAGSAGAGGTWNALGAEPPSYQRPREDTARTGVKARVKADGKDYPFTVAAHHCVPGEASLHPSELFKKFMEKGGQMELETSNGSKTYKLKEHIGYNVNGSHNGAWLPGSYAIRAKTSPKPGVSWGDLDDDTWKLSYMAAVVRAADGQFHDAHTHYNTHVRGMLNKLANVIVQHLVACEDCQKKTDLPPPYVLKARLYRLSRSLRLQVKARPRRWKLTLMTSDQVRTDIVANPVRWQAFLDHYDEAGT